MQFFLKILSGMANSVDPDQTALGLHCLHMQFCHCDKKSVAKDNRYLDFI